MSLAQHYLDTAVELISSYKGEKPFPFVLKQFFSDKKKYGSRDRKMIGQLCFAYFRLGKAWASMPAPDKMLKAFFLCQQQGHPLLKQLKPEWDEVAGNTTEEKLLRAGQQLCADDIFPWRQQTSSGIEFDRFVWAHLQQPLLFLRARPPHYDKLIQKLQQANIAGLMALPHNAIALPNGTKIEEWVAINREAVVQDLSSQQVGVIVQDVFAKQGFLPKRLWDCCAASGGKSIMLKDLYPALCKLPRFSGQSKV